MSDIIGITMGDPCGVGPEICVRALVDMGKDDQKQTRIYGNLATLNAARHALGLDIELAPYVVDLPIDGAPLAWGAAKCRGGGRRISVHRECCSGCADQRDWLHRNRPD